MFESFVYYIKTLFKQPFKVGIISYYYPAEKSMNNGVALHSHYITRHLAAMGCEVHVFTRTNKKIIKKEFLGMGKIIIHGIETNIGSNIKDVVAKKRMNYFVFDNKIINEISEENKKTPFEVIHTHGWLTAGAFITKYLNNIPWVHTFHALEKNRLKFMTSEEKKYFRIARWMESTIDSAEAIISVSEQLKKEAIKEYGIKNEKIFVIPNGVEENIFFPEENVQKEKQVLYVGRFSLEKGIDLLPEIAQGVLDADEKNKFVIVAANQNIPDSLKDTKKRIEYLAETYPGRFKWVQESVSGKDLAKLYNSSMIYVQPSRYESFGMTILEAMSCGCAVVCSNKGGIPEVVSDAGEIMPLNTSLFIKKITFLLNNYKLRERYSRKAIIRSKKFNWENIAKKTFDIYEVIAKNRKKNNTPSETELGRAMDKMEELSGI